MSTEILFEDEFESARSAFERGVDRSQFDLLGKLIAGARKSLGLSIDDLSKKTGVTKEDLIDLELGSFFLPEAVVVAEKVKKTLRVNDEDYKFAIIKSSFKR